MSTTSVECPHENTHETKNLNLLMKSRFFLFLPLIRLSIIRVCMSNSADISDRVCSRA